MGNNNRFCEKEISAKVTLSLGNIFKELSGSDVSLINKDDIRIRRIETLKKYGVENHPFFSKIKTEKTGFTKYEFIGNFNTNDYTTAEAYKIITELEHRRCFSTCKSYKRLNTSLKILALEFFAFKENIIIGRYKNSGEIVHISYKQDSPIEGTCETDDLILLEINELLFAKYFYNKNDYANLNITVSNEETLKELKSVKQIPEFLI